MSATNTIFISYRRSDSADITGRIYDRLSNHFGKEAIFKDVDSIPLAVDFRQCLDETVSQCKIVIAIIGPTWLSTSDEDGNLRLDNPTDWVRLELETAIQNKIPILPLLVGGARMPKAVDIPISIRTITYQNAASARTDPDFHNDLDRLITALEQKLGFAENHVAVNLSRQKSDEETSSPISLWVHGWDKQVYDGTPCAELHWTDYFKQDSAIRKIASPDAWQGFLLDELKQATQKLTQNNVNKQIDIKGRIPLTVALAIGKQFPEPKGYTLRVLQRTRGKDTFWKSSDDADSSASLVVKEHENNKPGDNLLFAIAISPKSVSVHEDVLDLYQNGNDSFDSFVFTKAEDAIASNISNADALALTKHSELLMMEFKRKYQANCIHLVVAAPQGFAVFLGQHLRLLGKVATYEHQPTDANHYVPSVILE